MLVNLLSADLPGHNFIIMVGSVVKVVMFLIMVAALVYVCKRRTKGDKHQRGRTGTFTLLLFIVFWCGWCYFMFLAAHKKNRRWWQSLEIEKAAWSSELFLLREKTCGWWWGHLVNKGCKKLLLEQRRKKKVFTFYIIFQMRAFFFFSSFTCLALTTPAKFLSSLLSSLTTPQISQHNFNVPIIKMLVTFYLDVFSFLKSKFLTDRV